jgi:tripartite-type tricarboxylate transporter receptor subunit TctC
MTGTSLTVISYKGDAGVLADLMGGQIMVVLSNLPAYMPQVKSGRIRALAVSAARRSPAAPDIPTMAESGLSGFEVGSWYGLLAPAGTPREIIMRLHAEVVKAVGSAEVRERFQSFGSEPLGSSPEEFAAQIKSDIAKWAKVAKTANVRAD